MDMKRSYYEDIQLLDSKTKVFWACVLMALLVAAPFMIPGYVLNDINYMAINIIVAIGLNILVGFTGLVSLGHAGFFAIGAYATALLMKSVPVMPFLIVLIVAGLVASVFGFILGLPSLKLEGPYLSIATLGFGMAIIQVLGRFSFFGGRMGLPVPEVKVFNSLLVDAGFTSSQAKDINLYIIIMSLTVLMGLFARNLIKTRIGRAFIAIRDSDIAAHSMGINLTVYKTLAFAVSAFYTGVAGGLYAIWLGYINPDSFDFILSILFLAMVVVGGMGSNMGPVLGGIIVSYLNLNLQLESISGIPFIGNLLVLVTDLWMNKSGLASVSFIIFGLILVFIVLFEPLGLFGFWIRIKKYWKTWPF